MSNWNSITEFVKKKKKYCKIKYGADHLRLTVASPNKHKFTYTKLSMT